MNRTNAIRKLLLSLLLAASAFAAPTYAQISFNINIAPPPAEYEGVPTIPPGYVWAPGYWGWTGERHVWIRGRPILQREGYRWEPDRWEQRGRTYYRTEGRWVRDKNYKPAKVKKAKKAKKQKGHGNNGKRGRGN